jgi:hypothetical protein
MGMNTDWIAVNSDDITSIQAILKLSDTASLGLSAEQQKQEYDKHHVEAYSLESGWYVIQQWKSFFKTSLSKVSQKYDVIVFNYCESAMQSKAQYWKEKTLRWEVFYDNSSHEDHCRLEYSGDMPDIFQAIKEKVEVQNTQAGRCYYTIEIPRLLIEKYLGQEYNEFGRPKSEIPTHYLSYDKPHVLLRLYKPNRA